MGVKCELYNDNFQNFKKYNIPTQKSVGTLKELIRIFTDPGDVVIDPCAGSASSLRAALELGRPSYGFEIDRKMCKRAREEMLDPFKAQCNLFDQEGIT